MEFIPIVVILATVKKLVDFVKYARNWRTDGKNGVITQLVAWAAGFVLVALTAHTPWAAALVFGGFALSKLGVAAQVLVGIAVGSTVSGGVDVLKTFDNTQSAAVPPLVRGR